MPRKPSPERLAEYEELKLFVLTLYEFLDQLMLSQPPSLAKSTRADGQVVWKTVERPPFQMLPHIKQGMEAAEAHGFSIALRAVRGSVNDLAEMTIDFNRDTLRQADEFLAQRGCKTLTSMREQVWQKVPKILRRGRIRNDEEYYLIIERLNDVSETGFQGADRERAGRMVSAYESSRPPD